MTGGEGAEEGREGKNEEGEREKERRGCNGFMQSYKHMSGVFWLSSRYILGGKQVHENQVGSGRGGANIFKSCLGFK